MKNNTKLISLIVGTFIIISACSLSNSVENQPGVQNALTSAAQTVSVQLTKDSEEVATNTPIPVDTQIVEIATAIPSNTPAPTATDSPTDVPATCENVQYVSDITIEDGTDFSPGDTFTKTWRLKNTGTCSWTTEFDLVFYTGEAMGGPASQQLVIANVAPGATADISVDLIAPAIAGRFRGNWILRNEAGILFGINGENPFWVEIEVIDSTVDTIAIPESDRGSVRSDGQVLGVLNVGDDNDNDMSQGFLAFDITGIPDTATITNVYLSVDPGSDTLGNPFADLGCVYLFPGTFFPLDASDYSISLVILHNTKYCSLANVNSNLAVLNSIIQSRLAADKVEFVFRILDDGSDSDGVADMIRFDDFTLHVEYTTPH